MRTPLGVLGRVQLAESGLSAPCLALAALSIGLTVALASPLAYYPGVALGLEGRPVALRAPSVDSPAHPDLARVGAVATLVSARGTGTYVIEGRIIQGRDGLQAELRRIASNPARRALPVLVRADRSQTLQGLADVLAAARAAGFPGILLAAESR